MKETILKKSEIQQQAIDEAIKYNRSGLELATGVGKTKVGLEYLEELHKRVGKKPRTLIVAPKTSIFQSWLDDASKFNLEHLLELATFTTYLSLNKKNPNDYDVVILDEAHSTKSSHLAFLSKFQGRVLGLTGTPPRFKNSEKGEMMVTYYPIRFVYRTDKAIDEEILNDYRIIIHTLALSETKNVEIKGNGKRFFTSELRQYNWVTGQIDQTSGKKQLFLILKRINMLKQFTTKELFVKELLKRLPKDEKCILFANTITQAELLCKNSHHSKKKTEEDLENFKKGTINVLSCVEQLSEGINIPNLRHGIIMHTYSGNSPKTAQKLGRLLRLPTSETATIHILCYRNTVDEKWARSAVSSLDPDKIKIINH